MIVTSEPVTLSFQEAYDFLANTQPFNLLDRPILEKLAHESTAEFFPQGTVILERGKSQITHLSLIYQGRVRLSLTNEQGQETLQIFRDVGDPLGVLGMLRESLSNLDATADQDTICLIVSRKNFLDIIQSSAPFSQFYLKFISEGYLGQALTQLERPRPEHHAGGSLYLFTAQVEELVRREPVVIMAGESVREAARKMSRERVGCLLVDQGGGVISGIITDRDLRTKVVAEGLGLDTPVEAIMNAPVASVSHTTAAFDALLEMMKRRVHHLAVEKAGRLVGVLSGHDLMVLHGTSPLFLVREIMAQNTFERVYELSHQTPRVVRHLIYEGAKPTYITRMITLLNDYILDRVLTLQHQALGQAPAPFCWLLMGSEGRKEQTFRTDQDNGLLYRDPENEAQAKEAEEYFRIFAERSIEHLVNCGFPRCHGDIMASNPMWRKSRSGWQGLFDNWIKNPQPKAVLHSTIFFDVRPGWGDLALGESLREHLVKNVPGQEVFLRFLAGDCLNSPPALTMFKGFGVEKKEPHRNKLDLKTRGLTPLVDFARLLSLKHGLYETNTLDRLQGLADRDVISRDLFLALSQSYEFQMQLRLVHQQMLQERGQEPDNFIDPAALSEMDVRTLKDALGVIGEIKAYLKAEFRLGG